MAFEASAIAMLGILAIEFVLPALLSTYLQTKGRTFQRWRKANTPALIIGRSAIYIGAVALLALDFPILSAITAMSCAAIGAILFWQTE